MSDGKTRLEMIRKLAGTHAVVALRQFTTDGDGSPDITGPTWLIPKDDYAELAAQMTARYGEPELEGFASWDAVTAQPPAGVSIWRGEEES
jgi:hypothetical protein